MRAGAAKLSRYSIGATSCSRASRQSAQGPGAGLARARAPFADLAANSGLLGHLATPASTTWCLHADRLSRAQGQGHLAW